MSLLIRIYQRHISRHPYIAQGIQTSFLMTTGDAIAQIVVEKKKQFDYKRSSNFLLLGFCTGLILRKWFGILQTRFSSPNKIFNTMKKVAADQLLASPILLGVFVSSIGLLQGCDATDIKNKLEREYPTILLTSYKLWPAVQLINFCFVPLNYQVPLVQIVGVGWNTYISFKTNSSSVE